MKIDHTVHSYPKIQSIKEAVHRRSEHNFGNVRHISNEINGDSSRRHPHRHHPCH